LIAHSLSNISAKNYQNRLMCVNVSVQHQCRFFRHSVDVLIDQHYYNGRHRMW